MKDQSSLQRLLKEASDDHIIDGAELLVSGTKTFHLFSQQKSKRYKFYDVSSLTKILATTPLIMILTEQKKISLLKPVSEYLPFLKDFDIGKIKISQLLSHTSGLTWWKPYYLDLLKKPLTQREGVLKKRFQKEEVKFQKKCVYSDLDFILLGWLIEEIFSQTLDQAAFENIYKPLGLKNIFFNPKNMKDQIAPTGDSFIRKNIRGVVQDDNAFALGGIAGHAGLFSTVDDVHKMGEIFLSLHNGRESFVTSKTFRFFSRRAVAKTWGDWALGFTLPSPLKSLAGENASPNAFGHLGFTGTSLWVDPRRQAVVTFLTNRSVLATPTHPERYPKFQNLRRVLHDTTWEILDG